MSGAAESYPVRRRKPKGTGPASGGQAGDTQGLPETAESNAESVTELLEEGQAFEAEVIAGVEEIDSERDKEGIE
jgi:hypothetical protein